MAPRLRPADQPVRAFLYGRVSMVGEREEIISPETQIGAGTHKAAEFGWSIVDQEVELDKTGRDFARAGIRRAIAGVEAGEWEVVLVYRYDRFGRNVRDSLINIARVEAAGGEVVSATEPFDAQTAIGKYGRTNLLAIAELQSDLIGEGWKAAHENRRSRGLPHSGRAMLGYHYSKQTKRHTVDPDTAPIVVELYRRYLAGDGLPVLAKWLTSLGLPRSHTGVGSYLDSGFAAGLLHRRSGEYLPGAHDPIIDPATWEAYRAARRKRAHRPPRLAEPLTPYSGIVYCTACERRMHTRPDHRRGKGYIWCCHGAPICTEPAYAVTPRIEEKVLAVLAEYDAEVTVRARAKASATTRRAAARAERAQLARQITRLDTALVRLVKDRATRELPEAVYRQAHTELAAERAQAQAALDELAEEATIAAPPRREIRGLLRDWSRLPVRAKRDILEALLRVEVTRGEHGPGSSRIDVIPRWEA